MALQPKPIQRTLGGQSKLCIQSGTPRDDGTRMDVAAPLAEAPEALSDLGLTQESVGGVTEPRYLGMTKVEWLGDARVSQYPVTLRPSADESLTAATPEPFLEGRFQARFGPKHAAVYSGKKCVASYDFGNVLLVAPGHRGLGIGTELVYQWRTRFPAPGRAPTRTPAAQHIQEKVWERLMAEQVANGVHTQKVDGLPTGDEIVALLKAHPLVKLKESPSRVFVVGSFAKGTQRDHSDIDVLLEIRRKQNGDTAEDVAEHYRGKIRRFFIEHDLRGKHDSVHPQWNGRRVDIYFTFDADEGVLPKVNITKPHQPDHAVVRMPKTPVSPEWLQQGVPIHDVYERSGDAGFILDSDFEADENVRVTELHWRECIVPICAIPALGETMEKHLMAEIEKHRWITLEEERERYAKIHAWVDGSGGIESALRESPLLLTIRGGQVRIEDGYHRLGVAVFDYGATSVRAICAELPG